MKSEFEKSEFEEIMDRMGTSTLADFGQDGEIILTAAYKARTVEDAIKTHLIDKEHARRANEDAKTKKMYIAKNASEKACSIDSIVSGQKIFLQLIDVHMGVQPHCDIIIIDYTPKDVLLAIQKAMRHYLVQLDSENMIIEAHFVGLFETEQPR